MLPPALSACEGVTTPSVAINQDFTLAPGETVLVQGTDTRIRFVGVESDSRCPLDATCIQAGDAVVKIAVQSGSAREQSVELHTASKAPLQEEGLEIVLVQLAPYPASSRTIELEEYRATLRATNQ